MATEKFHARLLGKSIKMFPPDDDFKAKLHQIRFRLGLRPRPRWGSLPPSCIWRAASRQGRVVGEEEEKGKEREGKWRGGKWRAPKLLLNQCLSEPCYATGETTSRYHFPRHNITCRYDIICHEPAGNS